MGCKYETDLGASLSLKRKSPLFAGLKCKSKSNQRSGLRRHCRPLVGVHSDYLSITPNTIPLPGNEVLALFNPRSIARCISSVQWLLQCFKIIVSPRIRVRG